MHISNAAPKPHMQRPLRSGVHLVQGSAPRGGGGGNGGHGGGVGINSSSHLAQGKILLKSTTFNVE